MHRLLKTCIFSLLLCVLAMQQPAAGQTSPSGPTIEYQNHQRGLLPVEDDQDFTDAQRSRISPLNPLQVYSDACPEGTNVPETSTPCPPIWNLEDYLFLNPHITDSNPPILSSTDFTWTQDKASIHPSLWRNAVLNTFHGVFEVKPGIYQVRGYDLANMSAIEGTNGWIIIDPLTTKETAREALSNLNAATGKSKKVSAVIFTHSHVDHFGGIDGLRDNSMMLAAAKIFAPEGFFEEAVSENVTVGNAMGRRATYMYGPLLPKGMQGQVDGGLGKTTPSGTTGIADPDCVIKTGTMTGDCDGLMEGWDPDDGGAMPPYTDLVSGEIDGVEIVFQNVPGSEAPAEMLFYFPGLQALCASEDVTHTFHNVLTLRGANVRDALLWTEYLDRTINYFPDADALFASHHWPTWNCNAGQNPPCADRVQEMLEQQRDLYRYIHDQSVRYTNMGYTIQEVGELVELPEALNHWHNRGYYGTVNHNAKAVYQRYIGWFDANPASLHQLPPAQAARNYVDFMGGVSGIMSQIDPQFTAGEYRWVAMVLNHVMFDAAANPGEYGGQNIRGGCTALAPGDLKNACEMLAETYDQLGYQSESGPWRNFYLTGAMELRNGMQELAAVKTFTRDTVEAMDLDMIFDFFAVQLDGYTAGTEEYDYTFKVSFWGEDAANNPDSVLYLKNGVLNHKVNATAMSPTATLQLTRSTLNDLVMGEVQAPFPLCPEGLTIQLPGTELCVVVENGVGYDQAAILFDLLGPFEFWFEIVTPNDPPAAAAAEGSSNAKRRGPRR